jgi:hypothetical protein
VLVLIPNDRLLPGGNADPTFGSLADDLMKIVALGLDLNARLHATENKVLGGNANELDLLAEPGMTGAAVTGVEIGALGVIGMILAAVENVADSHLSYLHNVQGLYPLDIIYFTVFSKKRERANPPRFY